MLKKLLPLTLFALLACNSMPVDQGLDRVKIGMDKDEVLQLAGNPKHSYHQDSKDHWIFDYYVADKEMFRELTFENGQVTLIGPAKVRASGSTAESEADDMGQFEKKMRESQKQDKGSFQDVPEQ